jgi:protein-disulfide isomerase
MASRAEAKAKARAERIEFERKLADAAKRKQRLTRLAGVVAVAVIAIVAAIVISSKNSTPKAIKPNSRAAAAVVARVDNLLKGIPESGNNTLGNPSAPIQVTEYGDLECSACDDFALATNVPITSDPGTNGSGVENQLISQYVRTGRASLVYRSLETATSTGATPDEFDPQQAAALAAGLQGKAWYYIELFYNEQRPEGTNYVNQTFLDTIAKQVPGLNYSKWLSDMSSDSSLTSQVVSDTKNAATLGLSQTPAIVVKGPKGQAQGIQGVPSWSQLQSTLKSVS